MQLLTTKPAQCNYRVAALVGVLVGIIGAIVKFGWEIPFPPRTPERDSTNPPQAVLELLGVSPESSHMTYEYLGNPRPTLSLVVHFAFSIVVAVFYVVAAEKFPQIVPAPWDQPFGEHFSELFGHAFWLWVMELCRRDLRNRITHEPDPARP